MYLMYILTVKNSCPLKLRKQESEGYSFKLHLIALFHVTDILFRLLLLDNHHTIVEYLINRALIALESYNFFITIKTYGRHYWKFALPVYPHSRSISVHCPTSLRNR